MPTRRQGARLGRIPLGNGYFLYEFPSYIAFGGRVQKSFAGIVSLLGVMSGEFNASNGRFNLHGNTRACLTVILDVCRGMLGNISSKGFAACVEVGIAIGVGVI